MNNLLHECDSHNAVQSPKEVFLEQISRVRMLDVHHQRLRSQREVLEGNIRALALSSLNKILLVNATKGQQFYPSITDFFALLRRVHSSLSVSSVSYFDIMEFHRAVAEKGLEVLAVSDVAQASPEWLNGFDMVLFIGPSELMARLISLSPVRTNFVCLDLAFYHQLIEQDPKAFYETKVKSWSNDAPRSRTAVYSCQPKEKVAHDIGYCFDMAFFDWVPFNYIPIGFDYATFYASGTKLFDFALLGVAGRDYTLLDSPRLANKKVLVLPGTNQIPILTELAKRHDFFIAPRVDERLYARLLALSKCVLLPFNPESRNVFLSVNDALASGQVLVTCRHPGLARLVEEDMPGVLYEPGSASDMFDKLEFVLGGGSEIEAIASRGPQFAAGHLDINDILLRIVREFPREDA